MDDVLLDIIERRLDEALETVATYGESDLGRRALGRVEELRELLEEYRGVMELQDDDLARPELYDRVGDVLTRSHWLAAAN